MCGRFAFSSPLENLRKLFNFPESQEGKSRFNIAPTQAIIVVRPGNGEIIDRINQGALQATFMRWGLIPSWAKTYENASRMANARAESIADKPSFRAPFKRRRCVVPMTGYYEWSAQGNGGHGQSIKQPYYFFMEDGGPFAVAAIWESWLGADGSDVETVSIVTTGSNEYVGLMHHRMPVILDQEDIRNWCYGSTSEAHRLMTSYNGKRHLEYYPVSKKVNSIKNDGPELISAIDITDSEDPVENQLSLF